MLEMVGAVFAVALTVNTKLSLAVRLPSLTVTVMVDVPVWLSAGVTVTVRFAPEPPKTMLATGTKVGLEEAPETVRLPTAVCASPTVKAIGAVAVFWLMDRSAMLETRPLIQCPVCWRQKPILSTSCPTMHPQWRVSRQIRSATPCLA